MNVLALQKGIAQWLEIDSEILTYYVVSMRRARTGAAGLLWTTLSHAEYYHVHVHCICARGAPTILYYTCSIHD